MNPDKIRVGWFRIFHSDICSLPRLGRPLEFRREYHSSFTSPLNQLCRRKTCKTRCPFDVVRLARFSNRIVYLSIISFHRLIVQCMFSPPVPLIAFQTVKSRRIPFRGSESFSRLAIRLVRSLFELDVGGSELEVPSSFSLGSSLSWRWCYLTPARSARSPLVGSCCGGRWCSWLLLERILPHNYVCSFVLDLLVIQCATSWVYVFCSRRESYEFLKIIKF